MYYIVGGLRVFVFAVYWEENAAKSDLSYARTASDISLSTENIINVQQTSSHCVSVCSSLITLKLATAFYADTISFSGN